MTRSIVNHLSRYKGRHRSFSGDKVHPRRGDPSTYSGPPPKALNDSESVSGQRIRRTNRSQHLRDRRVSSEFALLRTRGWYPLARPYPGSWSGQRQLYYNCCTFSGPDFSPITFNVSTGRRAREPDYHVPRQRPVDSERWRRRSMMRSRTRRELIFWFALGEDRRSPRTSKTHKDILLYRLSSRRGSSSTSGGARLLDHRSLGDEYASDPVPEIVVVRW